MILLGILISIFSLFVPLLIQQGENLSLLDVEGLKKTTETLIQEISVYFQLDNSFWQQQLAVDNLFKNVNFGLLPELFNQILEILQIYLFQIFPFKSKDEIAAIRCVQCRRRLLAAANADPKGARTGLRADERVRGI